MNDKELFAKYVEKMDSFDNDHFSLMTKDILNGKNSYLRMKFKGSSIFNPEWIRRIEDCLYELGQIVNNPREVTTEEGNIVPIELARKINSESVQHLASHAQYIKDIDENGQVVPAKILGQFTKEELHTYENRFIATFIRRLILFVEKRYEFIKETVNLDEKDILYVKNHSIVNGQEVEIETKISVRRETEDDLTKTAKDYIGRIEKLKEYVTYYYNSPFMKEFKTEKNVRKPIILTNILRKNPLYNKCYETFLFIEKFDSLGVAFKVDRNFQAFNEKERKSLAYIMTTNLLSLESTNEKNSYKKTTKSYKPKLLPSIDDEVFTYGDLVSGPVEFVRSDEAYLNYLKVNQPNPPLHPNAVEKKYYEDEYLEKKASDKKIKEIEALLARKRREIAKYEKLFERLIAERNLEEAKEAQERLEQLRREEQSILDIKRAEIIKAAQALELDEQTEELTNEDEVSEEESTLVNEAAIEEEIIEGNIQEESLDIKDEPLESELVSEAINEEETIASQEEKVSEPVVEEEPIKVEEPVKEEVKKEKKPATKKASTKKGSTKSKAKKPAKKAKKTETAEKIEKKESSKKAIKVAPKKAKKDSKTQVKETKEAPKKVKSAAKKVEKKVKKAETAPKPVKKPTKTKPAKVENKREAIPGKFIVKTENGYYANQRKLSKEKGDAFIFDDFNLAKDIKTRLGGKIVKL